MIKRLLVYCFRYKSSSYCATLDRIGVDGQLAVLVSVHSFKSVTFDRTEATLVIAVDVSQWCIAVLINAAEYDHHCIRMDGASMVYILQPPQESLVDDQDAGDGARVHSKLSFYSNPGYPGTQTVLRVVVTYVMHVPPTGMSESYL